MLVFLKTLKKYILFKEMHSLGPDDWQRSHLEIYIQDGLVGPGPQAGPEEGVRQEVGECHSPAAPQDARLGGRLARGWPTPGSAATSLHGASLVLKGVFQFGVLGEEVGLDWG